MRSTIALILAFLMPVALAAPGDACSFLTDPADVVRCWAATADHATGAMFTKCADQMVRGQCEQLADPLAGCKVLAGEGEKAKCLARVLESRETFWLADGRQVEVPKSAVFAVRGLQSSVNTDLTMCHAAAAFCRERPGSLECLVGLANWGRTADWGR
jgi:hypothetical protein